MQHSYRQMKNSSLNSKLKILLLFDNTLIKKLHNTLNVINQILNSQALITPKVSAL